jgi:phosphoglycerol transferase MdoB-like AlkP superfamily enzyme
MKKIFAGGYYKVFLIRLYLALLFLTFGRVLLFIFDHQYFHDVTFSEFISIVFYGLRFDISTCVFFYSPFILLSILPFPFRSNPFYQNLLFIAFAISTVLTLAGNLLDCAYFPFTLARTTADLFNVLGLGDDAMTLLPAYLRDFWYFFLILIVLIFLELFLYSRAKLTISEKKVSGKKNHFLPYLKKSIISLIIAVLCIIGVRGGLQLRPISIMTAGEYTSAKNVALVLNTPFTILKTIGKSGVKNIEYFDKNALDKIFSPVQNYFKKEKPTKVNNVVVIILESFSKEYIGAFNRNLDNGKYKGYTPFLDSLMKESLVFTNAFANGKRSIEAIPAALAGIPSIMNDAYITSMYSGNNINSLASVLKKKKYSSAFFHGGTNGSMGFDGFAKIAGFDKYYGRSEYNNEKDYDGKWGIFDEPYLQYIAGVLDKTVKPFVAGMFTLSSHHPYKVPDKYVNIFPKGKLPIHQSIYYSDYSLRKFFKTLSQKSWFDSTLFVITADHTSESIYPQYETRSGMYAVPIIFYQHNSNLKGISKTVTEQSDIMPSIMDYLNIDASFVAFGESALDSSNNHFAINFVNETYQLMYKNFAMVFDGTKGISLYDMAKDSLQKHNILESSPIVRNELERKVKAIVQSYNQRLMKNEMTVK